MSRAAELGVRSIPSAPVELASVLGRVSAQPLLADRDQPPFPRSTRDGFACRAAEMSAHEWLKVTGTIRAGEPPAGPLPSGAAWEIMTGAAVPEEADAVAMLEHVERAGSQVRFLPHHSLSAGDNVVFRGAEARAGDELVPSGTRLGPAQIALAATCGYAAIKLFARPRVAILTTGDELAPVDSLPAPGQIRNSNAPMLAALVAQAGGEPVILPAAADTSESLDAALQIAFSADLLLISGGVSAGKFDLVEPALARLGAQFHFTGVRIQPGKPLVFGELSPDPRSRSARPLPFFGLPGNPISSAATFLLFGAPVLAALAGCRESAPRFALAQLMRDVKGKSDLTRFVPACCVYNPLGGKPPGVTPAGSQGSGDLAAFARSNCFLAVPEGADRLEAGSLVRILLF
jgi:molybdopterin molybdotransferase